VSPVFWLTLLGLLLAGLFVLAWKLLRARRPPTEKVKALQRTEPCVISADTSTADPTILQHDPPKKTDAPAPIGGAAPDAASSGLAGEAESTGSPCIPTHTTSEEPSLTASVSEPLSLPPSGFLEGSPVDPAACEAAASTSGNDTDADRFRQVNGADRGANQQEKQDETLPDEDIGPAEIKHGHDGMRITKRSSGGRGEYEISETFGGLTPWNVLDRPIVLELDGLAINTQIVLRNLNGKRRLRMDTSAGCEMHLHRQLASALLMPRPARDENTWGRDTPILRSGLYGISNISLSDVQLEDRGTVRVVPDVMETANIGGRESISCRQRIADVRQVWAARDTFPPDVARLLAEHERLLLRGGPLGENLEDTVAEIQQALVTRRDELGIAIEAGDDPLQALLNVLNERDAKLVEAATQDSSPPEAVAEDVPAAQETDAEEPVPVESSPVAEKDVEIPPPVQAAPDAEPTAPEPIAAETIAPTAPEEPEAASPAPLQDQTPETVAPPLPYETIAPEPKRTEQTERAEEPEETQPGDGAERVEETSPAPQSPAKPTVPRPASRTQRPRPPRPEKPKGPPTPRRYQPPQRGRNVSRRSVASNGENEDEAAAPARERPSPIELRLRNQRGGMVAVSLLPRRREGMPVAIDVAGAGSSALSLSALRDEWYQDVLLPDLGAVLRTGAEWYADSGDVRLRWSLAGRDLYVLGTSDEWSGYLSTSWLALGDEHAVLCVKEIVPQVEDLLRQCCDALPARLTEDDGVPEGWVVLRPVVPARPLPLGNARDIFDALRPPPDIEIALRGGIRLHLAQWLAGHPPAIRLYGDAAQAGTFLIDGALATPQPDGSYTARGWDSVGDHVIACGGQTKTYSIVDPPDGWDAWTAYAFPSVDTGICGALACSLRQERRSPHRVPTSNPILLGKRPGEIYRCPVRTDVSLPFYQAFPPFTPLWAVPADPMHADKSTARILVMPASSREDSPQGDRCVGDVRQWCSVILNCSRKGLALEPAGEEAANAWRECRDVARNLWRASR
jgi:hypothetical protein